MLVEHLGVVVSAVRLLPVMVPELVLTVVDGTVVVVNLRQVVVIREILQMVGVMIREVRRT